MPWPVYTERFFTGQYTGGWVEWHVPENMRAVITNVSGLATPAGGATIMLAVHGFQVWNYTFPASVTGVSVAMKLVAYQRETVAFYLTTPGQTVHIAGSLFADNYDGPHPPASATELPAGEWPVGPYPPPT